MEQRLISIRKQLQWTRWGLGLALALALGSGGFGAFVPVAKAQTPSLRYQEILDLLQLGYTEPQIVEHIEKAGMTGKFNLTMPQVLELRRKGVSLALIKAMGVAAKAPLRSPPPALPPVTLAELQGWLKTKIPDSQIIAQIRKRGLLRSDFTAFALFDLTQEVLSPELLKVLHEYSKPPEPSKPSTPPNPPTPPLARDGEGSTPPTSPTPPTPPLTRDGEGSTPPTPPTPPNPPLTRDGEGSTPPTPPNPPLAKATDPILEERQSEIAQRPLFPLPRPADGLLFHPGGLYRLPVPASWHLYEELHTDTGLLHLHLSPQKASTVAALSKGLSIAVEVLDQEDRFLVRRSLLQIIKTLIQRFLLQEPGFRLHHKVEASRWKSMDAATVSLVGRERGWTSERLFFLRFLRKDRVIYLQRIFAPTKGFEDWKGKAEAIFQAFEPLQATEIRRLPKLERPLTPQELIEKQTKTVVSISLPIKKDGKIHFEPAGTGFVVSKDGYVITNHHVAIDSETGKPFSEYRLNWDKSTGFATSKAIHVASYRQHHSREATKHLDAQSGRLSSRFQQQNVDIALLKIQGSGPYPFAKLSPSRDLSLGDRIVAIGFPLEGQGIEAMGNEDITATTGEISRLMRLSDRRINDIQHTAKISGGNSGGPLFSLQTGGVIGINSWGGVIDARAFGQGTNAIRVARSAMGLGYYYALPIDLAWQYFADVLDIPEDPISSRSWYDLGSLWLAQGREEAAQRALQRAIAAEPKLAVAYARLGSLFFKKARKINNDQKFVFLKDAQTWIQRGLEHDPEHPGLLQLQSQVSIMSEEWQTASYLLQKLIARYPSSWDLILLRSQLHKRQGKFQDALQDADLAIRIAREGVPFGHIARGLILYELKRYYEGQEALQRALKIDPSNFEARLLAISGFLLRQQTDETFRRLDLLEKDIPLEPNTEQIRFVTHLTAQKPLDAWKSFLEYFRRCSLHRITPEAIPLLMAGAIAVKHLKQTPIGWGLWGLLIAQHSRTPQAKQAIFLLAEQAKAEGMSGLRYALLKFLQSQVKTPDDQKAVAKALEETPEIGIPAAQLPTLFTKTLPRWSPLLIFQLFLQGPSLLTKEAAIQMNKEGFPVEILLQMLEVTKARLQRGITESSSSAAPSAPSPSGSTESPTPPPAPPPSSDPNAQATRTMQAFIRNAIRALKRANLRAWKTLCHPRLDPYRCVVLFQQLSPALRQGTVRFELPEPPAFQGYQHPQIGPAILFSVVIVVPSTGSRNPTTIALAVYQGRLFLVY